MRIEPEAGKGELGHVGAADHDEAGAPQSCDRRGVALVALSEPQRDITLMPAGTARVALRQMSPKPWSVERVETLPAIERFLKATGDAEIAWLTAYLPAQLTDSEIDAMVREAIAATGASSIKDMGKVMAQVKPTAQGRTDIGALSNRIKAALGG